MFSGVAPGHIAARLIGSAAGLAASVLLFPLGVTADGPRPSAQYRYLHPPPALAATNRLPLAGIDVLPVDFMRAIRSSVFTLDGQAGIYVDKGGFASGASATGVIVRIRPVETPPGLPAGLAADGNAYRFTATEQPGGRAIGLTRPATLTLRWPRLPLGIEVYRSGAWQRLCSMDRAILTPVTISCQTKMLGIFVAVEKGAPGAQPGLDTSLLAIITVLGLMVLVLAMGWMVLQLDES